MVLRHATIVLDNMNVGPLFNAPSAATGRWLYGTLTKTELLRVMKLCETLTIEIIVFKIEIQITR